MNVMNIFFIFLSIYLSYLVAYEFPVHLFSFRLNHFLFQRNDIAMAITKYDQFDFLIDIVPRDDLKPNKVREDGTARPGTNSDQVC